MELIKSDFQMRYLGSYLGILWAFIQPTIMICIFWFVFEVGFKSKPVADFPFILWLITGMFPWFFFSESVSAGTNSIIDSSFLVKKVVFRVILLPIIKILSALVLHMFFIIILFSLFSLYGYPLQIYNLQVIYYLFAMIILVLGITWISSALVVFMKDIGQVIAVIMQIAFWATPIFWSIETIPLEYRNLLKWNPLYYIIEGYRNCFIYHRWFWEDMTLTIYFWIVTSVLFIGGALLFRKLRPHFADVL